MPEQGIHNDLERTSYAHPAYISRPTERYLDCSDHHSRTTSSASAIGGGRVTAASASAVKARAVSSRDRMLAGST